MTGIFWGPISRIGKSCPGPAEAVSGHRFASGIFHNDPFHTVKFQLKGKRPNFEFFCMPNHTIWRRQNRVKLFFKSNVRLTYPSPNNDQDIGSPIE